MAHYIDSDVSNERDSGSLGKLPLLCILTWTFSTNLVTHVVEASNAMPSAEPRNDHKLELGRF